MISLRKREKGTPLIEGLYVVRQGHMYQIRVQDTQEVLSAVPTVEDLVKCGKVLIKRYQTIECLRRRLSQCEYRKVPEQELIRREYSQKRALEGALQQEWYSALTGIKTEVKEVNKKRKKLIKIVDKGQKR